LAVTAFRRRTFSVLMASVVAGGTSPAHGREEVVVSLDYGTAPALRECPSSADFRGEIARQLGRDPFREIAPRRMVVRLFPRGARIEGRVEWRDANDQWQGERTFSSRNESCAQMTRAMALGTAIQIQLLAEADAGPLAPPAADSKAPPMAVDAGKPGPGPPPTLVIVDGGPALVPVAKEPRIAVGVGLGVIRDAADGPTFMVPRIAVSVGRPSAIGVRATVSGLGPGAEVTRSAGSAQIDRLVITLELVRFFRSGRRIQPMLAVGAGVQDVRVRGTSAMPALARAHEGQVFSGLVTVGGGLAFTLAARLSVTVELGALLFRPSVTVDVGSSEAAHLDGAALFAQGGLLARF
jgi:hypothetical protein